MKIIDVRKIFRISLDRILLLKHNINIKFEDGYVIEDCDFKKVILYRYLLDFVNELDLLVLDKDTWLDKYSPEGYFKYDSYTSLYSYMYKQYIHLYIKPDNNINITENILILFYKTINLIPKKLNTILGNYVVGAEVIDILRSQMQDNLLGAMAEVYNNPSKEAIDKTYEELDNVVNNILGPRDIIKLMFKSDMVNINQLRQLYGSRGYVTEIDSSIFAKPMVNSFTLGFRNIYDMSIESRTGAKALHVSTKSIQTSEFMAREFQLATMPTERIEYTDCGNKQYTKFYVRSEAECGKSDLINLIGKRFFNYKTGKEETITDYKSFKYMEGTTISLRQATRCKLRNKKNICSACIGEIAYSIFKHQNLGHTTTISVSSVLSQLLLSTKHLTKSANDAGVKLNKSMEEFFSVKHKDRLYIQKKYLGRKTKGLIIHIPQSGVRGFLDIIHNKDILSVNLSKSSKLEELVIEEYSNTDSVFKTVDMKVGAKYGMFTNYFWNYLIKTGYNLDEMDNYTVCMDDWDYQKPIIMYEEKEYDYTALIKQFSKLVKTRKYYRDKVSGVMRSEFTPEVMVEKIFTLLNAKLNINIAIIEIFVSSFIARDISKGDYDLGRSSSTRELIGLKHAIDERSLGGSLGWSKLESKLYDSVISKDKNKPDHPMDVLLRPTEVLEHVGED